MGVRVKGGDAGVQEAREVASGGRGVSAAVVALKDLVAISNGSACTSSSYTPSHVIKAMGYGDDEANEAIRLSWCHLTPQVEWDAEAARIVGLR